MHMLRRWIAILAVTALTVAAAPVAAQTSPAGRWQVDWGDQYCSLIRHPISDQPIFAIRTTPGSGLWQLRLVRRQWPRGLFVNPNDLTVRLHPGGTPLQTAATYTEDTSAGIALVIDQLGREFPESFASSERVTLERDAQVVAEVALRSTRAARDALRRCEEDVMREWGIDPTLSARLGSWPRVDLRAILSDSDYPAEALRANMRGRAVVRITIGVDGKASGCVVVASSGHSLLDQRTCQILVERVRTSPAIDTSGTPVSVPLIVPVRWVLAS